MTRATLIFGNGLGLALDPVYFSLASAMSTVWNQSARLDQNHKDLIASTLSNAPPAGEEQLESLQLALAATELLNELAKVEVDWLSQPAKELPQAFRHYVHEVGFYFHQHEFSLPNSFIDPLVKFVAETKSHVATLNYDNLLYDPFVANGVLDGYSGSLIDGFHSTGFSSDNMIRYAPAKCGWYLHLHGSPLYVKNKKLTGKARLVALSDSDADIVLTHEAHKPILIEHSKILRSYWSFLRLALAESKIIFLVGYSGCDSHLNDQIAASSAGKKIFVIEWEGAGAHEERRVFWSKALKCDSVELLHKSSVLVFDEWADIVE